MAQNLDLRVHHIYRKDAEIYIIEDRKYFETWRLSV